MFCRERGLMKDIPALLCTVLSVKDRALLNFVFPCVIDNPKMLLPSGKDVPDVSFQTRAGAWNCEWTAIARRAP